MGVQNKIGSRPNQRLYLFISVNNTENKSPLESALPRAAMFSGSARLLLFGRDFIIYSGYLLDHL